MSIDNLTSDRNVVEQTLWMGAITVANLLGTLVQVLISARILGLEGFGVLSVIMAVTTLVYGLLSVPGGDAVTAFVTRSLVAGRFKEASCILRFVVVTSFGLSLVAYILIVALTRAVSGLLGVDEAYIDAVFLYGVVGILMATHTGCLAMLRLSHRVPFGLGVVIASILIRIALLVVTWWTGGGLLGVILAYVVGAAVNGIGMFSVMIMSTRQAGMKDFLHSWSLQVPSDMVRFHIGISVRETITALSQNLDTILVAQFVGVTDAGLYRGARQIIDTLKRLFRPLESGIQSVYSRQWFMQQGAALRRMSFRFTLFSLTLAAVGCGLLAVFREPVVWFIFGAEFSGIAPLLLIMVFGLFFVVSTSVLGILPAAAGRVWPSLLAVAAGFVVSTVVIVWLVPVYGAEGAAWARTVHFLVLTMVLVPFTLSVLRQSRQL